MTVTRTLALTLAALIVAVYLTSGACPPGTNVVVYTLLDETAATMELYALFD